MTRIDIARPPAEDTGVNPETRAVILACEAELETNPDPLRAGRLHYEIAQAYEEAVGWIDDAARHYASALAAAPDHVPTIRGARRIFIAQARFDEALPLFAAEAELTPDPHRKAELYYEQGRLLEDVVGDREQARAAYTRALELDALNASVLKALEQCAHADGRPGDLLMVYEHTANAVSEDARHRAALIVQRARLVEQLRGDTSLAAELYETALRLDPHALAALDALKRLYRSGGHWRQLATVLEREARQTGESPVRSLAMYQVGRVHGERLGNRAEALTALNKAADAAPRDRLVLEELSRLYEREQDFEALAEVMRRRVAIAADIRDRVALLHALGQLCHHELGDLEEAVRCYQAALAIDPLHIPLLRALAALLATHERWPELINMHLSEAEVCDDPARAAAAHARIGEIFETHLNRPHEAAEHHERALGLVPGYPASFAALTRLYAEARKFRELIELYEREADTPSVALAGSAKGVLDDPPIALAGLSPTPGATAAGPTEPKDAPASERALRIAHLFKVGWLWEDSLADPVQALHAYRRVLEMDGEHLAAIHAVQRVAERAERYRDLVAALEREAALVTDKRRKLALLHRAGEVLDEHLDEPEAALARLGMVLEIEPGFIPALASTGRIYHRSGRWTDLLAVYERELSLALAALTAGEANGNDASAPAGEPSPDEFGDESRRESEAASPRARAVGLLHAMGELCEQKLGDADRAVEYWRRAVGLDPSHRPAMRALTRKLRELSDWTGLADALEAELAGTSDAPGRAIVWYRIGQVHEERLTQPAEAIAAYQRALAEDGGFRPARVAAAHLYVEAGEWMKVIEALTEDTFEASAPAGLADVLAEVEAADADDDPPTGQISLAGQSAGQSAGRNAGAQAGSTGTDPGLPGASGLPAIEPVRAANVLMQQAEIYRDRLEDRDLAAHCFEALQRYDVGRIPALLALEPLYAEAGAWAKLARVYSDECAVLAAPSARIAALRELARVQEVKGVGGVAERLVTYEKILAIDPDDAAALLALARIGRDARDPKLMARAYNRLSEIAGNDHLAAEYLTRLGQTLERHGDRRALDAYRAAVARDPQLLTAIRGLSRVGDLLGKPRDMAHAARLEAQLTRKPELAAKLFVRAGIIRREQMNDLGAVEDYERALDVWPDDADAARRIVQPLIDTGQIQHLVDVLSKAADGAQSAQRKTWLWREVGALYTQRLDNLGAGVSALKRALRASPGDVASQSLLAEAYERNEQWGEAVASLQEVLALTSDDAVRCEAHLKLASILDEQLGNRERARKNVQAVLRSHPDHADALLRLADIQLRSDDEAGAVATTQKLVELAKDPRKKGAALVRVARIQRARGELAAADQALKEALALEGPGGDAAREFIQAIEEHGNWAAYAAGIAAHIERLPDRGRDGAGDAGHMAAAYLELAKTYADGMNLPNKAIETLREGITKLGPDGRMMRALAVRLREVGRTDDAVQQLRNALAQEPTRPEYWTELSVTFEEAGRRDDATRAMAPLVVLGAGGDAVIEAMSRQPPRPALAAPGSFSYQTMRSLAVESSVSSPAAKLLAAIADAVGKVFPPALEQRGLTRRERLGPRSNHPLWELSQRVAQIYGAEFELYEHRMREPMIAVEVTEPAAIVVSQGMRDLPTPQQTFLLGYAMAPIAGRIYAALALNPAELEELLVASVRLFTPSFPAPGVREDELEEIKDRLRKSVPRKWRKPMETAALEFAERPPADLARWQQAVVQTAIRAAVLVSDDLAGSVEALRHVGSLGGLKGASLVASSASVRDLFEFWASERAATLRRRAGITTA